MAPSAPVKQAKSTTRADAVLQANGLCPRPARWCEVLNFDECDTSSPVAYKPAGRRKWQQAQPYGRTLRSEPPYVPAPYRVAPAERQPVSWMPARDYAVYGDQEGDYEEAGWHDYRQYHQGGRQHQEAYPDSDRQHHTRMPQAFHVDRRPQVRKQSI